MCLVQCGLSGQPGTHYEVTSKPNRWSIDVELTPLGVDLRYAGEGWSVYEVSERRVAGPGPNRSSFYNPLDLLAL